MTRRPEGPEPRPAAPHIHVEPWPAGGWVVRLGGDPRPLSRHDTEDEAQFRAAAYLDALERGHRLAFRYADKGPA